MGNSRPGGRPRGADGSSSTGREDAGRASGGPATPAPAARGCANKAVMDTPRLPSRGGPGEPGPRKNAPAPSQERGSPGPGNVMRPCSVRQHNGARLGTPSTINNTASNSLSRDSDRSAGSTTNGPEEPMGQNASSSSKKRKRMSSRSYLKRFKPVKGANAADVVVASPDRVGKENSSSGHVADCKISKLCEGSRLIEKNKRHSSDAACKVSKSLVCGLHETSETRVNQCSAPFSEVQPPKPTDVRPQNIAAESSLPVKARDRPTALARQSCLSSLQSVPTSLIHHEEESSTSGCRNTEHIEIENITKPSMGGATSLVRGVNANNDDKLDTDGVHLESPNLAASQSLLALVGTQAVLSCMSPQQSTDLSAQQNVVPSRCPPAEAEQTGLSGTQALQVLQLEMQPSILFLDAPPQKTHPDDRSQRGCQPDKATGLSQGGASTSHHLDDVRMQVQENFDRNLGVDPVFTESPTYPANSPVTLQVSTEVESQICESSMDAKQRTSPPAQQSLAISRHPPAEAEPSGILGTEAAWDLQPEVQPSISMQDQPTEAEQAGALGSIAAKDLQPEVQPSISMQDQPTEAEQAGALGSIAAQDLQPEMQLSTSTQDTPFERTCLSGMPVLQNPAVLQCVGHSLDPHTGVESVGMVTAHDLQSEIQPSASVPAEQSTSPPAQQSLATLQHPPAEAKPAGILGIEPACYLQPEVQSSTSLQDEPAEAEDETESEDEPMVPEVEDEPEAELAGTLGAITSEDLQPEMQSSTSTQLVSFERVEPSLDRHAGVESAGTVTAHDLQSEILPSASVPKEQSTSLPAQLSLVTSRHSPAEAGPEDILCTESACDLQPLQGEMQPSTTMQDQPAEGQACILGAKLAGILGTEPACDLEPEVQPSTSVQDEPAEAEDETEAEDEPEVPGVEDESEIEDEPVEAERAVTLGAITAEDLQPEMLQPSTSMQVAPFERTYRMSVLQSPTIRQRVEPLLDPHAGVESAGAVTAHDLQSEVLPSASVPMEQSTSLPAQLSLETSLHSPAEVGPADILGTEAAHDLQPSQGEMQTSTAMQDQPAEGQACILGAIAAQILRPETQLSTSTQFERTHLVGMPVLQSLTLHHSVEPSLNPHARAESTHTLGSLIVRDLQSEVQPLALIQDRPAEVGGAVMFGSTTAEDLQPELQSSNTVQQVPLERIHSEERRQIGFQPNMAPSPEQPTQRPPVTTLVFNNPMLSDEPLKNELDRLMHCNNVLSKDHEHKKSLLLIEYNQEIEKIKKNYDLVLQKEDSTHLQTQRELTDIYRKVSINKSLAENFRGVFRPSSAAQGRSTSPVMEQRVESSSAAQTTESPVVSSSAIRPPGSYVRPLLVAQPSSSSWNAQQQTILPGNLYGTSSPSVPAPVPYVSYRSAGAQSRGVQPQSALPRTMSPVPLRHLPHGSYGSAGEQLRASAPHLQQLRMPLPYDVHTDQQQLPVSSPGFTQFGQYAPVIMRSYASTVPSSVHHIMLPSASNSQPPRQALSLPSGRHPESMVNLQSSSPNPAFFPAQQSSYQNVALGSTSGLPNAAPGSQQHAGAQIAGVNQPGYESALLDAYLLARCGLGSSSSPAGAGVASAQVVCLSDDES